MRNLFLLAIIAASVLPSLAQAPPIRGSEKELILLATTTQKATATAGSEEEKVRAIYHWISANISYDIKKAKKEVTELQTPGKTISRKKGICGDYVELFSAMCRTAGIACLDINGYINKGSYEYDDSLYNSSHAWNVVRIDGEWKLVDITFASGYVGRKMTLGNKINKAITGVEYRSKIGYIKQANDAYFLTDPCLFIKDHLPTEKSYQLLKKPLSKLDFESMRFPSCDEDNEDASANDVLDMLYGLDKNEYYMLRGDSAFVFNEKNILEQALNYRDAAFQFIISAQLSEENPSEKLSEALPLLDTCAKMLPFAKDLTRQEAQVRSTKNKIRKQLAEESATKNKKINNTLLSKAKAIEKSNKTKIESIIRQNTSISEKIAKINAADVANIEAKPGDKKEQQKIISTNKRAILANSTQINKKIKTLDSAYNKLDWDQVIRLRIVQDSVYNFMLRKLDITAEQIYYRSHHLDNLDSQVMLNEKHRDSVNKLIELYMHEKETHMNAVIAMNKTLRDIYGELNILIGDNLRMLKENKKAGDESAITSFLDLQLQAEKLSVFIDKNVSLGLFLIDEVKWAARMESVCNASESGQKKELSLDKKRYAEKEKQIKARREALMEFISELGKETKDDTSKIKKLLAEKQE